MEAFRVLKAGWEAISEVQGLKSAIVRAMALTYALFLLISLLLNGLLHYYVVLPLLAEYVGEGWNFWQTVAKILVWWVQLMLAVVSTLLSLRLTLELMEEWHTALATRVVRHHRNPPEVKSHPLDWFRLILETAGDLFRSLLYSLALVLIGLIPVLGGVLIVLAEANALGRKVMTPYAEALKELKLNNPKVGKHHLQRMRLCWISALLVWVPVLGWLLMPWVLLIQVVGYAHYRERKWMQSPQHAESKR